MTKAGYPNKFTPDNKVNFAYVEAAVRDLTFKVTYVPESTLTLVSAFYEGFSLAVGQSACVNPLNYNPVIGEEIAQRNAITAATNKLWELFGWDLHKYLQETGQLFPTESLGSESKLEDSNRYPALSELAAAVANYTGTQYDAAAHDAKLLGLRDTGKVYNGHSIYSVIGGFHNYIILGSTKPVDSSGNDTTDVNAGSVAVYTYITVSEPAMYQLHQKELDAI